MPNWCSNHITVRGSNQAEIQRLAKAFGDGELCNAVIPVPEDLQIVAGRVGADDNPDQIELERKTAENIQKYGVGNWYDFCTSRWGTKWDVSCDAVEIDEDGLGFSGCFDSAWAPPMGIVEELVNQGYEVTLFYYEPGMAYCGKFEDGVDDYYDYSGTDSKTVRATIGDELDDFFGISESMAEYEAENEEELTAWVKDGVEKRSELKVL